MTDIDITAIIVNYNTENLLLPALNALKQAAAGISLQTIIIDNASRDNSVALIKQALGDCQLIVNEVNVGFGRANNQALPYIKGRYVLLLNTDAFVSPDTLKKTLDFMQTHEKCGILGVKLAGRDGTLQPSCRYFPTPLNLFLQQMGLKLPWVRLVDDMDWDHASSRECDWVPGCYLLIRKEVIDQVGLFDNRYFLYSEEVDFCLAAKKSGWQVHYFPDTTVVHIGGESARSDGDVSNSSRQIQALQIESELLYFRKNHGTASVLLDVLLHSFADLILPIKRMLKARQPGWSASFEHLRLFWMLLWKTRFGSMPTR